MALYGPPVPLAFFFFRSGDTTALVPTGFSGTASRNGPDPFWATSQAQAEPASVSGTARSNLPAWSTASPYTG